MLSTLVGVAPAVAAVVAAETEPTHVELPMPPIGFGIMAIVLFAFGLLALWSFRGTAYRSQASKDHDVAGTRPGTTHEERGDAGTVDPEFEDVGMTETGALKREGHGRDHHDGQHGRDHR